MVILFVFGLWALAGSWHNHPVLGVTAAVVYLELGLASLRVASLSGGVVYNEELAQRIAPVLVGLCNKAGCQLPRVIIRDDAIGAACVRSARRRVLLVVSKPFVDRVDDRQLRAILAHEVVHIARRDLTSVKTRMWVAFVFAIVGVIALEASGWGGAIYPEYVAAFVVVFTASQVALSILNRPLETRADAEGAGG